MPHTVASDEDMHCLLVGISMISTVKVKSSLEIPKTKNGLIQMIRMENSTFIKWVKQVYIPPLTVR